MSKIQSSIQKAIEKTRKGKQPGSRAGQETSSAESRQEGPAGSAIFRVFQAASPDKEIMEDQYGEQEMDPDPWYEQAIEIEAEAKKRIAKLESRFGDRKLPRAMRHARFWLLGGAPFLIGFIAFIHTRGPAWEIVLAIVGMDS